MANTTNYPFRKKALSVLLSVVMVLGYVGLFPTLFVPNVEATSGGTYYVRVWWRTDNTKNDSDNQFKLYYRDQDGTEAESSTVSNTTKNSGTQSADFALSGIPYGLWYRIYGRSTAAAQWYITKITVSTNSNYTSDAVTLWEGEIGCYKAHFGGQNGYCTVSDLYGDSMTYSWSNEGSDLRNSTSSWASSYFHSSYHGTLYLKTLSMSGDTTVYTSGSATKNYTLNTLKDQFGVPWNSGGHRSTNFSSSNSNDLCRS